ncbi:MAG TPA: tetratricopeptide repeat protein, partial [Kofleriaceae bacterium]
GTGPGPAPGSEAPAPKSAGSSPVESVDVPAWTPPPARFAVAAFENHSTVRAFDWLIAGAPFEAAEKTEAVLGLEPAGGPLYVDGAAIEAEQAPVAAFARSRGAAFVITGWVERPNWQLRIDLSLWRVTGGVAVVAAEARRTGDVKTYHQMLGEALGEIWTKGGGVAVDAARLVKLQRPLAIDLYAVNLMGRGLGHLTGAIAAQLSRGEPKPDLKSAEHDLERAVFIDPKCFEAQRLLGEVYLTLGLSQPGGDPKQVARATAKFNYANDLAPDDLASLRAAATGAAAAGKHDLALELFRKLVTRQPWDLDARYQLGAALWHTGDPVAAEKQLEQVTSHRPDDLPARRVLVLIHASRSDAPGLIRELEAIARRVPADLEVKADLASAYGAQGMWDKAIVALEAIDTARPGNLALAIRIGDAHRRRRDLDGALAWYVRAARQAPESSWPGFVAAQALFDAGRLPEAIRAYTQLQKFRDELPAAEQALGTIALAQHRADDAAWYLRKAAAEAPRSLPTWRALVAAELSRKDGAAALKAVSAALPTWPDDAALHYLAGVAHGLLDDKAEARRELGAAAAADPALAGPRAALSALDAGAAPSVAFTPELVRPWGDADAVAAALDRYARAEAAIAKARAAYQRRLLGLLGQLNRGPLAPAKPRPVKACPLGRIAGDWAEAQRELAVIARLGVDLEQAWKYIARHDEVGATAGLLPNARTQVVADRKAWKLALADMSELRAEWGRALGAELVAVGCTEKLLKAAVADPARYHVVEDDLPEVQPPTQPPRPRARATFYVDNSRCPDPVEVWVDGTQLGQVPSGRRSGLVADGGERTLCLLVPGQAQCGDRGTVRQVYLHDGWSVTMHCLRNGAEPTGPAQAAPPEPPDPADD